MSELTDKEFKPARVWVSLNAKVSDGNYGSIGGDFGIEGYQRPDETPAQTFDRVYNFVEARLSQKLAELHESLKK